MNNNFCYKLIIHLEAIRVVLFACQLCIQINAVTLHVEETQQFCGPSGADLLAHVPINSRNALISRESIICTTEWMIRVFVQYKQTPRD